ncbi:MAG: HNH endonuclease [Eubacteriales bacterium]|nr:HNH endonuclease [Eubacteriales bacterium]
MCCKGRSVYEIDEMHADHIMPWSKGGKTVRENCQMLYEHHNLLKSNK